MIDTRVLAVVEDANKVITPYKTKFVIEEGYVGTLISYAEEPLVWMSGENPKLIHIFIPRTDIRTELGMLLGEVIVVTRPVVHLIVDKVLHTDVVLKMLYEQFRRENENDKK